MFLCVRVLSALLGLSLFFLWGGGGIGGCVWEAYGPTHAPGLRVDGPGFRVCCCCIVRIPVFNVVGVCICIGDSSQSLKVVS